MKWLFTIILMAILVVPVISRINYLRKNDLKIFRHLAKEDTREEELIGSQEVSNFRIAQKQNALKRFGYDPGIIDGSLGKNTRKAIREFQVANIIVFESARDEVKVGFFEYFKVGLPLTFITLFLSVCVLVFLG